MKISGQPWLQRQKTGHNLLIEIGVGEGADLQACGGPARAFNDQHDDAARALESRYEGACGGEVAK
jgi:hypothetical protein